jgi:hypothetical protein
LLIVLFAYCIDCKFHFFYFVYFIVLLVVKFFPHLIIVCILCFSVLCLSIKLLNFFLLVNLCLLTFMLIDLLVLVNYLSLVICYFDCCNVLFQIFMLFSI